MEALILLLVVLGGIKVLRRGKLRTHPAKVQHLRGHIEGPSAPWNVNVRRRIVPVRPSR